MHVRFISSSIFLNTHLDVGEKGKVQLKPIRVCMYINHNLVKFGVVLIANNTFPIAPLRLSEIFEHFDNRSFIYFQIPLEVKNKYRNRFLHLSLSKKGC